MDVTEQNPKGSVTNSSMFVSTTANFGDGTEAANGSINSKCNVYTRNSNSSRVRLKFHHQHEVRIVSVTPDTLLCQLVNRLERDYKFSVQLWYRDREGDLIILETQNDWLELLQNESLEGRTVNIFVMPKSEPRTRPSEHTLRLENKNTSQEMNKEVYQSFDGMTTHALIPEAMNKRILNFVRSTEGVDTPQPQVANLILQNNVENSKDLQQFNYLETVHENTQSTHAVDQLVDTPHFQNGNTVQLPSDASTTIKEPKRFSKPGAKSSSQSHELILMHPESQGQVNPQQQNISEPETTDTKVEHNLADSTLQVAPSPSPGVHLKKGVPPIPKINLSRGRGAKPKREEDLTIRWQKGSILGRGANGTVYSALNLMTGKFMAVKQLHHCDVNSKELSALQHEIDMLKDLDHPNIVRYIGTEKTQDTFSIFLELVPGGCLRHVLDKFGVLDEPIMRLYTRQLLLGLEYLHSNGIAHRDIKCANVLVRDDGTIKLADFGASKRLFSQSASSNAGTGIKGTPLWMAPEVIRSQQDAVGWKKADMWSVGCTVIEMATGKPPWHQYSNPVTAMYQIANAKKPPELPPGLSNCGAVFLTHCLQLEPSRRPDVTSILLHPFVTNLPVTHTPRGLLPVRPSTSDVRPVHRRNRSQDGRDLPKRRHSIGPGSRAPQVLQLDKETETLKQRPDRGRLDANAIAKAEVIDDPMFFLKDNLCSTNPSGSRREHGDHLGNAGVKPAPLGHRPVQLSPVSKFNQNNLQGGWPQGAGGEGENTPAKLSMGLQPLRNELGHLHLDCSPNPYSEDQVSESSMDAIRMHQLLSSTFGPDDGVGILPREQQEEEGMQTSKLSPTLRTPDNLRHSPQLSNSGKITMPPLVSKNMTGTGSTRPGDMSESDKEHQTKFNHRNLNINQLPARDTKLATTQVTRWWPKKRSQMVSNESKICPKSSQLDSHAPSTNFGDIASSGHVKYGTMSSTEVPSPVLKSSSSSHLLLGPIDGGNQLASQRMNPDVSLQHSSLEEFSVESFPTFKETSGVLHRSKGIDGQHMPGLRCSSSLSQLGVLRSTHQYLGFVPKVAEQKYDVNLLSPNAKLITPLHQVNHPPSTKPTDEYTSNAVLKLKDSSSLTPKHAVHSTFNSSTRINEELQNVRWDAFPASDTERIADTQQIEGFATGMTRRKYDERVEQGAAKSLETPDEAKHLRDEDQDENNQDNATRYSSLRPSSRGPIDSTNVPQRLVPIKLSAGKSTSGKSASVLDARSSSRSRGKSAPSENALDQRSESLPLTPSQARGLKPFPHSPPRLSAPVLSGLGTKPANSVVLSDELSTAMSAQRRHSPTNSQNLFHPGTHSTHSKNSHTGRVRGRQRNAPPTVKLRRHRTLPIPLNLLNADDRHSGTRGSQHSGSEDQGETKSSEHRASLGNSTGKHMKSIGQHALHCENTQPQFLNRTLEEKGMGMREMVFPEQQRTFQTMPMMRSASADYSRQGSKFQ